MCLLDDQAAWRWLDNSFAQLSTKYDGLRAKLIDFGRLQLSFADSALDRVDLNSAVLVCAALAQKKSLCISLPDEKPRRPAYLLAYALLNHWWRHREGARTHQHLILYCGTQTGIRGQLSNISVTGLGQSFSHVFEQFDLSRGAHSAPKVGHDLGTHSELPRVVTAYAPANPRGLIADLAPRWIAVDFADSGYVPWLKELLVEARSRGIPVLGWGTNPMSEALQHFDTVGHVVRWPFGRSYNEEATFSVTDPMEILFQPYLVTEVQPILVEDHHATRYYRGLRQARAALHKLRNKTLNSFAQKAIQQHWRLYREIETLHVPLPLREAEVSRIWGLAPLERQITICKQFQNALAANDGSTASDLELASDALSDAIEYLKTNDPPLWRALAELIHEEADYGCARLITFNSRAKKTLFVLALLAKFNITEGDLKSLGNWIFSVAELPEQVGLRTAETNNGYKRVPVSLSPIPYLVSLPSAAQLPRLWAAFLGEDLNIVIHSFEGEKLSRRVPIWSAAMSTDLQKLSQALADLAPLPVPEHVPNLTARVRLGDEQHFDISTMSSNSPGRTQSMSLWAGSDLEDELDWLFERDEDLNIIQDSDTGHENDQDGFDPWVEEALEIEFSGGWYGLFDRRDKLLYIDRTSAQCDERYISALRLDDTVLVIRFNKRQNLYNLVIERVHKHPSIELHLALLRRWHEELVVGFERWAEKHSKNMGSMRSALQAFLKKLQDLGSTLTSSQTVHLWVSGTTLCPHDPKDIARVGEILNLEFVTKQHGRIAKAASRIRGLHRGLSNRLANWLSDWSRGIADSHDQQVIDEETGLTFGDVRASFLIVEVEAVETVRGPFLRSALGEITRGKEQ